jgi:glycine cleavage system regulatory protein
MANTLILTFIARDRTGVVEQLTNIVTQNGGNWLESRMAHLAESFAGVARISVPDSGMLGLSNAVVALESDDFQLMLRDAGAEPVIGAHAGNLLNLDLVGPDHPGILHEITRTMAAQGVSVEEMETRIEGAPVGGGMLFHARARVRLPATLSEDDFRDALEASAGALMVDISVDDDY